MSFHLGVQECSNLTGTTEFAGVGSKTAAANIWWRDAPPGETSCCNKTYNGTTFTTVAYMKNSKKWFKFWNTNISHSCWRGE